jgi:ketosteroid isomerase-like protein
MAMDRNEEIIGIETQLAEGDDSTYDRFLTDDALVIVPGAAMTKRETVAAMATSPGWLSVRLAEPTFTDLAPDLVLLSYEFRGKRADMQYEARLTSIYRETPEGWRMAFHQQTPEP